MPSRHYIICYNIYSDKQKLIQKTQKKGENDSMQGL